MRQLSGTQPPPWQTKPEAQGALLPHMQVPASQRFEREEHWLLIPHRHLPLVQLSARVIEQVVQVPPSLPQADSSAPLQSLPEQQPPEHDAAVQMQLPPLQI